MTYALVTDKSRQVVEWAGAHMQGRVVPPCYGIGIVDGSGAERGALIWHEFTKHSIELTVYAPGALKRHIIRDGFAYAFNQLGVERITVRTPASNREVIRLIEHFGWKFEGIMRRFYGDDDAFIYGMLRHECRFLPKAN